MSETPAALLADVAVVALVVAHGMDADLDPRESRVAVENLTGLSETLTGTRLGMAELSTHVEGAVTRYGHLTVPAFEALVESLARRLDADARAAAFAVLVSVAEADGVVRTMEQTVLRHIATAWDVTSLE